MISGLLLRHYKNYANVRFVPVVNDEEHKFTVYIGNNGVGKSAVLEALDAVLNNHHKGWNTTQNEKKSESFICPLFLIPKNRVPAAKKADFEIVSNFFWSINFSVAASSAVKEFFDYRDALKSLYEKNHYLILVGSQFDSTIAYFSSSFDNSVKKLLGEEETEQNDRANAIRQIIWDMYTYLYIPVEESPSELLRLQNDTMQKLLNKDILQEIESILKEKQDGQSIVQQINTNLDKFIKEVNDVISNIDREYQFAPESGIKKSLTAKDIREKVIQAFFPLRSLKVGSRRIELLSSGEQRRTIIDIAYSTLIANGERKTEKDIILAIDEPETSMHISNCFSQFQRLERLADKGIQIMLTTHWYGYLPIAQNGSMHYLLVDDNQTKISSFSLFNLLEDRRNYPDDVELKSMFDLASSLVSFMRRETNHKWIFCEGSGDKQYLQVMLTEYKNIFIIPLGGCGNVIKLYRILSSFMMEKSEEAKADALFLIDTDKNRVPAEGIVNSEKNGLELKRLQIVKGVINLLNPSNGGMYDQTEMEDCLNPELYFEALKSAIQRSSNTALKILIKKYELDKSKPRSILRGDDSCIRPIDIKALEKKQTIIEFAENDKNKYDIARIYADLCSKQKVDHPLAHLIASLLGLEAA